MKNQEKLLVIVFIALVIVAFIATFMPGPVTVEPDTTAAEEMLRKAIEVGKGQTDYYYSYKEINDGYVAYYALLARGNEKMLNFSTPISEKQYYMLSNDTILCVDYMNVKRCSSVLNTTEPLLHEYLLSLQAKFFDEETMAQNLEEMNYFMEYGYVIFSPEMEEKTINGHKCTEISYVVDLSNVTMGEIERFNIMVNAPKVFSWNLCIDNRTGIAYSKHFNYSYQGKQYYYDFELLDYEWYTNREIIPPEEITEGVYEVLLEESEWKSQLQNCYIGAESERDRCISMIALQLKMKSLCELAGERRDRCLVSIVPLTLDESICAGITDPDYKDDCYTEMAGGTKNDSYCSMVVNATKAEFCMNISQPSNETGIANPAAVNCADKGYDYEIRTDNETSGEYGVCMYEGLECEEWKLYYQECCLTGDDCSSGNCTNQTCIVTETNSTVDMQGFLEYIETLGENETNSTESS